MSLLGKNSPTTNEANKEILLKHGLVILKKKKEKRGIVLKIMHQKMEMCVRHRKVRGPHHNSLSTVTHKNGI